MKIIKILERCVLRNIRDHLLQLINESQPSPTTQNFLRGDFLESRVFFAKTAQNLATKPSRKNALPPSFVLKVFQKYLRRKTEFYWICGYVIRQNIAKYKEG